MKVIKIGYKLGDVELIEIENDLHELQALVEGYIEPCAPLELRERGIELLANEEGLLAGLENNHNLFPYFFVGTLVMVGVQGDELVSLTDEQISFAREWLKLLDNGELYEVNI